MSSSTSSCLFFVFRGFLLYTCLYLNGFSTGKGTTGLSFFFCLKMFLVPGPVRASTTCAQFFEVFRGSFFHLREKERLVVRET